MSKLANRLTNENKAKLWETYDWSAAKDELADMQRQLVAAFTCNMRETVKECQQKIVDSLAARMLAVKHVCESKATPGIDSVRWSRSHEKMSAAFSLSPVDYLAKPTKLITVHPKNGRDRHIKLPTMYDRAMQVLYSYTITPYAETHGDKLSENSDNLSYPQCKTILN